MTSDYPARPPHATLIEAVDPDRLSPESRVEFEMTKLGLGLFRGQLQERLSELLDERPKEGVSKYLALVARLALLGADRGLVGSATPLRIAGEAVESDPENPLARYQLAAALDLNGQSDEALQQLRRLERDPVFGQSYEVLLALGAAHYNRGDFQSAVAAYRLALKHDQTAVAHMYFADALGHSGDGPNALQQYRAALLLDPTLLEALNGYWFYVDREATPEPKSSFFDFFARTFGEARPVRPPLNRWLRPFLWRLLYFRYKRHPEDARLHYMLGFTALLRGDLDFAIERLQFIYDFAPIDLEALAALAVAQGLNGDFDEARGNLVGLRDAPSFKGLESPQIDWSRFGLRKGRHQMLLSPFFWEPRLLGLENTESLLRLIDEVFTPPDDTQFGRSSPAPAGAS